MRKTKISFIFDFLFGVSFVFLVVFVWTRYFLHDFALTIIVSIVISFVICALYYFFVKRKQAKNELSNKEFQQINDISLNFLLSTKQENLKTFMTFLPKSANAEIKSDQIVFDKTALKPIFNVTELTDKEILESYTKIKNTNITRLIICCKSISEKGLKIARLVSDKEIVVLNQFEAYKKIYKPVNYCPVKRECKQKKQNTFKNLLAVAFNKKRTKDYFWVSFVLIFSSFILRYNIYYLISASITCCLALYAHFNKRFNKFETNFSIV